MLQRPAGDLRNSLIADRVGEMIDAHSSGRTPTAADTVDRWSHDKYVGKDLRDQIGGGGGADRRVSTGARVVVRPDGKKITSWFCGVVSDRNFVAKFCEMLGTRQADTFCATSDQDNSAHD